MGKNGHGKSSIALILEEVLFNKNSKGIKKANILNRHVKDKNYSIELVFEKDGDEYVVKTTRSATQTVTLTKNGENISSHTATATFKLLEEILGFDSIQLIYQSSSASLEFLTATDTNRKKFLIELLNLTKYTEAFEVFKTALKSVNEDVAAASTKISVITSWIEKNSKEDLNKQALLQVPEAVSEEEFHLLNNQLTNIVKTNKKIGQNNLYRSQLAAISVGSIICNKQPEDETVYASDLVEQRKTVKDASALISKIEKLDGTCPTCLQTIDKKKLEELVEEQREIQAAANKAILRLDLLINHIRTNNKEIATASKLKADWENYHALVDHTMPLDTLDAEGIRVRVAELTEQISKSQADIDIAIKHNNKVSAHNSRVEVISSQMDSMRSDLEVLNLELGVLTERATLLSTLQKTFSTNGLIAYKIENLVKDLEHVVNEYLAELSSGRFQLTFKVSVGDKLNVIITDNGSDIEISALSGGERARVNTATLLAIRKLMQSLSNARINLLILDETVDSLDDEGKEKLIEILVKEEHLNTFLISHGFTHPLLEKILVVKEKNISRLE